MALELTTNFAVSTIATAPSPASSGTSLVVAAGDGAKFPAASFNAIVWPANAQPTTTNAEVVRVTGKSTDTFTISRAQESSSARTVVVGDRIYAGVTAKTLKDLDDQLAIQSAAITVRVANSLVDAKGDLIGASANDTPARVAVGTNGQVLVADSAQANGVKYTSAPFDLGLPGVFAPQLTVPAVAGNTVWPTANLAYFLRFVPARDMTITLAAWRLAVAAGSNDAYDIGLYSASGANLAFIASLGATSGVMNATTGIKTPALSASLTAGTVYYVGMSYGAIGTTAATLTFVQEASGASTGPLSDLMGTAGVPKSFVLTRTTSHPLPTSTITSGLTGGATLCPLVAVRES